MRNLTLAQQRMKSALDFVYANLSPTTRRYVETSADASVATWEPLVAMLRADSLVEEADKVKEIVDKYEGNPDRQSANITRLPFYRDVIARTYLPRLRRVSYEFVTSQYRYLTDDEIAEVYAKKPASLSRFEFFRLYRNVAKTPEEKETMLRKRSTRPRDTGAVPRPRSQEDSRRGTLEPDCGMPVHIPLSRGRLAGIDPPRRRSPIPQGKGLYRGLQWQIRERDAGSIG